MLHRYTYLLANVMFNMSINIMCLQNQIENNLMNETC